MFNYSYLLPGTTFSSMYPRAWSDIKSNAVVPVCQLKNQAGNIVSRDWMYMCNKTRTINDQLLCHEKS